MSDHPSLHFDEVRVDCLVCGRQVVRPKKRRGRHTRFCSEECRDKRMAVVNDKARKKYEARKRAEGGRVESLGGLGASDRLGLTRGFFPADEVFSAPSRGNDHAETAETAETVGSDGKDDRPAQINPVQRS